LRKSGARFSGMSRPTVTNLSIGSFAMSESPNKSIVRAFITATGNEKAVFMTYSINFGDGIAKSQASRLILYQ
jgi:hypothetical protein